MPRDPRLPNPPGHQNAVGVVEQARPARLLERLGFDPLDVHLDAMREAAVIERLVEALVGILVPDVLADDVDRDVVARLRDDLHELFPGRHAAFGLRQVQVLEHDAVQAFRGQHERDLVDRRHVLGGDDRFLVHVAEQRDLALDIGVEKAIRAAQQDVRLDADGSQVADAVLCRLGLQLAGGADERHQRQVHVEGVVAADVLAELADGFEEGQAFDVADRAADLHQHDVDVFRHARGSHP